MRPVLLRVDGGRIWGLSLGHLTRALMLAEALAPTARPVLVMRDFPDGVAHARAAGAEVELLAPDDEGEAALLAIAKRHRPRAMVFDLPRTPYTEIFAWCRANGCRTLAFDITGGHAPPADVVVNDALAPALRDYAPRAPGDAPAPRFLLGPGYCLLAPCPPPAPPRAEVRDILVTLGGSDPAGLTTRILEGVVPHLGAYRVRVALGPCFAGAPDLAERAGRMPHVTVVRNPPDFADLLGTCDLAISAGGRTLYELAQRGKPVVVTPSIEHEVLAGRAMRDALGWKCLDLWDERSPQRLLDAAFALMPLPLRRAIFERATALVDGRGLARVLAALLPYVSPPTVCSPATDQG